MGIVTLPVIANDLPPFFSDVKEAQLKADEEGKSILMVFAGSDWCKPCIQFKKEILESPEFEKFAEEELVILYLDFPAKKKNRLSDEQTAHNEALAARFNKDGSFPKALLMDADLNLKKDIKFSNQLPSDFIQTCKENI
jgi:thioredoxin-related protein